ncbi:MAG: hypothetical protein WBL72_17895 [Thermoguttaceae bacterium]
MTHITFDPYIPLAMWAPLALATAALLGWYAVAGRRRLPAWRWWTVVVLMAAAAAVPLVVLLNPTWLERIPPPPGKPLLTILIDRSASMATRDGENGQTRYQAGVACAAAATRELGERYDVRLRTFAKTPSSASLETLAKETPDGAATDLAAAVEDSLEDDRPQGQAMLLLSDGIHNAGPIERLRQTAAKAKAMAAPIYVRPIGGAARVDDLEVGLEQPQELAFVGQRVPVVVSLRHRGSLPTKTSATLLLDGKLVERRDVTLKKNDTVEEVFQVSHKAPGLYRYEVRADALPGEVTTVNNSAPLLLRVVDQPIRVLLLEGKPYWDTKFLVRTLSADESIELTSVVQLAEGRLLWQKSPRPTPTSEKRSGNEKRPATDRKPVADKRPATAAAGDSDSSPDREQWAIEKDAGKFLADADALAKYQIVILGRNAEAFLTDDALAKLRKWLTESEGSLVCFRGPPASQINQRLGDLMPLRWAPAAESRFHLELTDAGQALRWLPVAGGKGQLAELPALATADRPEAAKALAVVLAKGVGGNQASPMIVYQPVGSGRVVVVEGAGMWRWAFLAPEHQKQEEVYGSLWRSLVRWLVSNVGMLPSQRLALRADKLSFTTDENVTATLLVRDWSGDPPQVQLSGGPDAAEGDRHIFRPTVGRKTSQSPALTFRCVPRGSYPGQFSVGLGRLPEGQYALRVAGIDKNDVSAVAAFDVRGNLAERLDVAAQPNVMKMIARESGGAVLAAADPRLLAQQFDRHLGRTRPERTAQTMAWDRWWALLGAFAVWGTAWGLRRRSGLV